MPYIIEHAHGFIPPVVGEHHWGEAPEINFGTMSSCIAVIEQSPDAHRSIRAVHLSLVSRDGTPVFDPDSNVMGQIVSIMHLHGHLRACLGCIDLWQHSDVAEVQDFFGTLVERLQIETRLQLPDGHLRARWYGDTIQYAQGGGWLDIPYRATG